LAWETWRFRELGFFALPWFAGHAGDLMGLDPEWDELGSTNLFFLTAVLAMLQGGS
jgi:hypothetical protein